MLQSTKETPIKQAVKESFSLTARTVKWFNTWSEKEVLAQRDALFVMFPFPSRRIINKNCWLRAELDVLSFKKMSTAATTEAGESMNVPLKEEQYWV